MATIAGIVDRALRTAGIPLEGVSIGDPANRATWVAVCLAAATAAQRTQAADILATVAVDAAAQAAYDLDTNTDADAQLVLVRTLVAYLWRVTHGGVNPTGAQLLAEMSVFKTIYRALS